MATNTVAQKKRRAWTTTVFVKQLMALSGLFLIFFLLFHAYGNLKLFIGPEAYDSYAEWLHNDAFYPIFPHGTFIWVFRFLLLGAFLIHIFAAAHVWAKSKRARRHGYVMKRSAVDAYAARTMRITGVLLLFLIIFHLLQFTTLTIKTGFTAADTPYERVVASFQEPWVFIMYLIFVALVTVHVAHGFWSAFQTMGWVRKNTRTFMLWLSGIIAGAIFVMFMLPPLFIATGVIR